MRQSHLRLRPLPCMNFSGGVGFKTRLRQARYSRLFTTFKAESVFESLIVRIFIV
jgi:hypothetical protein